MFFDLLANPPSIDPDDPIERLIAGETAATGGIEASEERAGVDFKKSLQEPNEES